MISRELEQLRRALINVRTDGVSGPVVVGLIDRLESAEARAAVAERINLEIMEGQERLEAELEDMRILLHQILPYIHDGSGGVDAEEGKLLDKICAALAPSPAGREE